MSLLFWHFAHEPNHPAHLSPLNTSFARKRPKAEEDDPDVKGGDDSDEDEHGLKKEEPKDDDSKEAEAVEVRDIRYAIENILRS